jgi:hypothetical protein
MSIDQDRWSINPLIDRWLSLLETGYSTFRRPMSTTVLGESFSPSARKASLTDAVGYPPRPVVTEGTSSGRTSCSIVMTLELRLLLSSSIVTLVWMYHPSFIYFSLCDLLFGKSEVVRRSQVMQSQSGQMRPSLRIPPCRSTKRSCLLS